MSQSKKDLFIMPSEFADHISALLSETKCSMYWVGRFALRVEDPASPPPTELRGARAVLTRRAPALDESIATDFFKVPLDDDIVWTPPVMDGKRLFISRVVARAAGSAGSASSSDALHRLPTMRAFAKRIAPGLKTSTRVDNVVSGASAVYRNIWHSAGAREWIDAGNEWRQLGVDNLAFFPEPT